MSIKDSFPWSTLAALVLGAVFGWIVYGQLVRSAYDRLNAEIESARAFSQTIQQDPAYSGILVNPGRLEGRDLDERSRLWRLLVNMNILDWDTGPDEVSDQLNNALQAQFNGQPIDFNVNGLDFLIDLGVKLGNESSGSISQETVLGEDLKSALAKALSGSPGGLTSYASLILKNTNDIKKDELLESWDVGNRDIEKNDLKNFEDVKDIKAFVLNNLFLHFSIGSRYDALPGGSIGKLEASEEYRQVKEFFLNVLLNVLENPKVTNEKAWVTLYEGPEQMAMSMIFFCALLLLILRVFQLDASSQDSRVKTYKFRDRTINWLIATLPAVGFIGTLRGLSNALGEADTIVRAGSQVLASMAIADVTDMLKVAFTTTLIALLLGILLELIKLILSYSDNNATSLDNN